MRILSVDPGKAAGWCLRTEVGVEAHGAINGSCVGSVDGVIGQAFSALGGRHGERLCYLEDPIVRAFESMGRKSLATLIRRAEIWAVLAERLGVRVVRVSASTWQAHLRLRGTHDQRMSGLRGILRAQSYDVEKMTEDECCACGIDLWAEASSRPRASHDGSLPY